MIMSVVLMRLSILCAMVDVEDCVARSRPALTDTSGEDSSTFRR